MKAVPEDEVRNAQEYDEPGGRAANPLQAGHAHQNEKARDRGNVMQLECREEIDAQAEEQQSERDPEKSELPDGYQKDRQRQIQRR